ncbi:OPT family oligopeptide transporter [Pseudobacteriovorax antillogorgiicola]|uniref:Putative oligopeptide transporter, OPT family n=1 Tax=Pseudobacteriovorax antillogorgiicola TaxID=1513793 RepID=A0A1Y6CTP3_9BACT|nr:OPT/YSL family transporter [Pseudobacteriovorax antillogorgiicola]TCS44816.1 putative OPT family oligopeptide transporter [Pseudobacteriovorax antillogorgiicola]SMF77271.1 putative oligopeptide transporter, OPT family [Pseudobacteriovorax antillogorgiicola]
MPKSSYRELTVAAVVLGILQGIILNLAFVYAALKLGFSIGGSTVAAIMGYALLKGVLKKGTSIENNVNQTIASGINTAGTGVVFTLPAIFMLYGQSGQEVDLLPFIVAAVAGTMLGIVFIIPLRKQMIDIDRLRFPSGVAVTTIIRSGSGGLGKAKLLAIGFLISAIWKFLLGAGWLDVEGLIGHEELNFGFGVIPDYLYPVLYLSLMNLAAGLLAGKGGIPFFIGGVLAWWVVSPAVVHLGWVPTEGSQGLIYGSMLRPLGIGALIGGALVGVILTFPAIKAAIQSLINAGKSGSLKGDTGELPAKVLGFGIVGAALLLALSANMSSDISIGQTVMVSLVGVVWIALAGLIVAQATGMTDISPMSGMALITVTLVMFMLDKNISAAMAVAVAVCVAIGQAADMMQDLKTGFMVGGQPAKQQIAQFATTWIGAIVSVFAIYVLWKSGPGGSQGFGEGTALPAPQAGVLMGIIEGLSTGNIPLDKYLLGGGIGVLLGFAPVAGLGVLIGLAMYLPFSITLGYGLGCLIQMGLEKAKGPEFCAQKLVPFAAGLIIGEAIMGIGMAGFDILKSM